MEGPVSELLPLADGGIVGIPLGIGLALLILFRARRMSITVDESGLTFRNFWKQSRYRWQQIEKVEVRTPLGFGGRAVGLRLKGEQGFGSKAPASTATLFGGQHEQRSQLLETLRRFGGQAGVPVELGLLRLGVWESAESEPSDPGSSTGAERRSTLGSSSRLKRFVGSLLIFGPLGAAAVINGDIGVTGVAIALAGAAVVLVAVGIWDHRRGGGG